MWRWSGWAGGSSLLDGRPTGVDPSGIHHAYVLDLTEHGLEPVPYETFTETDMRVYGELKRMHHPPVPERWLCVHLREGGVPADQETVDAVASSALLNSLLAARRGHAGAERELLDLMGRTEDGNTRASRIWGAWARGAARRDHAHAYGPLVAALAGRRARLQTARRRAAGVPQEAGALLAALGQDPMLAARPGPGEGARRRVRHLGLHAGPRHRVAHPARGAHRRGRSALALLRRRGDAVPARRAGLRRRRHELPGGRRLRGGPHGGRRAAVRRHPGRRPDAHRRIRPIHHARRAGQMDLADHGGRTRLAGDAHPAMDCHRVTTGSR